MSNFCPSCGAKVEEGNKFCLRCGAQLNPENISDSGDSNENISQQPSQQDPQTQPPITPSGQKKSNKNLLIALIAIIAIIVIVIVIIFSSRGLDSRFIGEWEIVSDGFDTFNWIFNGDGSVKMKGMGVDIDFATWSVSGNQICLKMLENDIWGSYLPEGYENEICYDFEFSNGGNTVYLSIEGSENFILTKI
jgi:hypothetical protein